MSAFFTLHRDLPREGPGETADVLWVLGQINAPTRVADLACGPGADLVTFAGALPGARLHGIDRQAHFVAAAQGRLARFGPRVTVAQGDMAEPGGPYDLIWCAGAIYVLGVGPALGLWRAALPPGGHVAFSVPVLRHSPPDRIVQAFWDGEGGIASEAEIGAAVTGAGWRLLATRLIVGAAWAAYYEPMAQRIAALLPGADAALAGVLADGAREVFLWRQAPDDIAYLLCLVAPE